MHSSIEALYHGCRSSVNEYEFVDTIYYYLWEECASSSPIMQYSRGIILLSNQRCFRFCSTKLHESANQTLRGACVQLNTSKPSFLYKSFRLKGCCCCGLGLKSRLHRYCPCATANSMGNIARYWWWLRVTDIQQRSVYTVRAIIGEARNHLYCVVLFYIKDLDVRAMSVSFPSGSHRSRILQPCH